MLLAPPGTHTPDHCYTVINDSCRSVPHATLGHPNHCLVHLIPSYRKKLRATAKPVVITVKKWTEESKLNLQACFDCTDWVLLRPLPLTCMTLWHHMLGLMFANKDLFAYSLTTNPGLHRTSDNCKKQRRMPWARSMENCMSQENAPCLRKPGTLQEEMWEQLLANPDPSIVCRGLQNLKGDRKTSPHTVENLKQTSWTSFTAGLNS